MYSDGFLKLLTKDSQTQFFISTHKYCDGDGLGAGLALYHGLRKKGKQVSFFVLETPHPKYKFMDSHNVIRVFDKEKSYLPEDSILLFVDVNDSRIVEPIYSCAKQKNIPTYFIDHHPLVKENQGDHFFIDDSASSTAELIQVLLKAIQVPLDQDISSNLFCSLVFDTNLFRNIKNSTKCFSLAAELTPYIKDVNLIYDSLFKNLTVDKLRFFAQVENIEYYFKNRLAFLHLKERDFEYYNTDVTQAYDLMDIVRDIKTIESTALIIEKEDGSFKLSLRSRKKDLLPLVQLFDGGGHHYSAGAYIKNKSFSEVKNQILSYLISE